ncbi:hypothetical protein MMC26_003111 [Xylographa opegraphella]|nr:hypothetical protein [Xylographa opegraphella]
MTTQELNLRLKSLSEALHEVSSLIAKLSKLSALSNTSSPHPDEAESRVELSAEIHQSLKEQEEDYDLLKQEVEDLDSSGSWASGVRRLDSEKDRERITLLTQLERLGEDLKLARAQFRKAQLQAKRNEEAVKRKEREQLFAGIQEGSNTTGSVRHKGHEKVSQDDLLVNASSDVTAALRRTHQLMQAELSRSQFANDTLKQSTAALSALNENYSTLDDLLSSSRSLVSTLISSQKSDTWYLESAFKVIAATIVWLIFRRFLLGPARLFFYPVKWMLSLVTLFVQVSIGAFISFAGAIGGSSPSSALSNVSTEISSSTSLIIKPSATGKSPRFRADMSAPYINVGAGSKDKRFDGSEPSSLNEGSLSDKVGQMAENSRQGEQSSQSDSETLQPAHAGQDTVLRERTADEPPNPKKRMFEEPPAPLADGERVRDEL